MSQLKALYTMKVTDKDGKTISKVTKPCKSFVLQFLQLIECQHAIAPAINVKNTAGADNATGSHAENLNCAGIVGSYDGINVGTGTTAVTNTDVNMETRIDHGVGAGQLSYGAMSKVSAAEVGANVDFQVGRVFTNTSGNTINVTEIGIINIFCLGAQRCLTLHEIVTLTAVANGQTLTVTITYRTTV